MNKLVVLSGVPGSGKSHVSYILKERMTEGHLYVVSSDELRKIIGGSIVNLGNDTIVWNMYYDLASVYSKDPNGIVVLDSTNLTRSLRIDKVKPLKPLFNETILVLFKLNKDIVRKQNLHRPHPVPPDVLEVMFETMQDINIDDTHFFDKIIVVTDQDLNDVVDEIVS